MTGDDACADRDLLARPPARVAASVPALVVEQDVRQRRPERLESADQPGAVERMPLDLAILALVERTGLAQDGVADVELADVMERCAEPERPEARVLPAEPPRDDHCERAHAVRVPAGVRVACFDRLG